MTSQPTLGQSPELFSWVLGGVVAASVLLFGAWGYFSGEAHPESGASSPLGASGSSLYAVLRTSIAAVGVITIGGGAAIAFRRQKTVEEQAEIEKDKVALEKAKSVLEQRKADLEQAKEDRARFADLHTRYQQAASQLGSDTNMIRIAGVYALEALADEWAALGSIQQRGVCIDLLCGYLRSTPPRNTDPNSRELLDGEVRETITAVISRHLQDPDAASSWSDHSYNFKGATFVDLNFFKAHFNQTVNFMGATFTGPAWFSEVTFTGNARFIEARFTGNAGFRGATFTGDARFGGATFTGPAWFSEVTFTGNAEFSGARFTGIAGFRGVTFTGIAWFEGATFKRGVPPEVERYLQDHDESDVLG